MTGPGGGRATPPAASWTAPAAPRENEAVSLVDTAPVDVILRDGSTLRLRPPRETDRQALVRFFEGLSERSLYLRFHGRPNVDERLVEPMLDPDWADRGALIGSVAEEGEDRIVALADYARLRDPLSAEVAFAVADAVPGTRCRNAAARAASRACSESRNRALHRRGDGGQRCDAPCLRGGRLRDRENALRGRGRDDVPDRSHGRLCLEGRRARPHLCGRLATSVLRGPHGCRSGRLVSTRNDRRRAFPQRPRR